METILVTGATGFLGKHLVEQLKSDAPQARLRVLCRGASPWDEGGGIEVVRGNITSRDDVRRAAEGASEIYHLAGIVSRDSRDAERLYLTHVEGTRNVCEAALAAGAGRVLHVSSSGTVGVSREPVVRDETSGYTNELVGEWPYYLSKIFAERLALEYFERHQLPVVVVNPSLLLGPGDDRRSSTGDVALFLRGQILAVPLGGLNFVDARDAARGAIAGMRAGRPGERYLLGGVNWTFREFIGKVAAAARRRVPRLQPSLRMSLASTRMLRRLLPLIGREFALDEASIKMSALFWYCDSSKAREELGFIPRDPHETVRDTVQDLRRRLA
ncbi:MAG TPA: NAD-dependent epimerase/dehydratase family protein [Terriglobia bacterium]